MGFGVTRNGQPLRELSLTETIYTGIHFDHVAGCIPVFYEVDACNQANYQYFGNWQLLTPEQQSFLIGHYFTKISIANHQKDAEAAYVRKQRQKKGK